LFLFNFSAYFAPSCISHIVLTKPNWSSIKINGTTLPQAVRCWELYSSAASNGGLSSNTRREIIIKTHKNQYSSRSQVSSASSSFVADEFRPSYGSNRSSFNQQPILSQSALSFHRQSSKRSTSSSLLSSTIAPQNVPNSQLNQTSLPHMGDSNLLINRTTGNSEVTFNALNHLSYNKKKSKRRHKKHKKRQQQQEMIRSKRLSARQELLRLGYSRPKNFQCRFTHIDSCSWPQCNSGCPKLHNPFTGRKIYF